ncbi:MAG: precorrin-6A/cobalt-precorrin-6A reductase [Spirochaetaceae bacterium]|jgi:precorrin-2 dehydrogenase/sirohydrochlorin ferrochelatase/precorrin-6A/cobalt-precorrin-6A reductase|nr:precorrin-6A/cobalt-precorrin-6A reductase [Spirochaetaceae bacterium]
MMTICIFSGTGDGKKFIALLLSRAEIKSINITVHIFCATEYGAEIMKSEIKFVQQASSIDKNNDKNNVFIHSGRLDEDSMLKKIQELKPDYIIDCTHPYAEIVTKNIKTACEKTGFAYIRLRREKSAPAPAPCIYYVDSMEDAASFLKDKSGNILLCTGSKDLHYFSDAALRCRVYPRVLPLEESLRLCRDAGITAKNIIAMQGPFSEGLNRALIQQINAAWLVSKETGAEGGFNEKINAAAGENCNALVIRAPDGDAGFDAETIINIITNSINRKKQFFPVFQNITNKKFLIVGAGVVALRRLRTLLRFDCSIKIIAPSIDPAIKNICDDRVSLLERSYKTGDCEADFVVAAANDRAVNRMIGEECKSKNIPVSVADCKEESTFYFPAIVDTENLTIGISSGGLDHKAVSGAAGKIRRCLME